jgi:hypothetical protein
MGPSVLVEPYSEGTVASKNKDIVRSPYFKTVNKRVCTNQEQLDDEEDHDIGTCNLSGDQLMNSGMLKRRKFSGVHNFKDVSDFFSLNHHRVTSTLYHGKSLVQICCLCRNCYSRSVLMTVHQSLMKVI